MGFRKFLEVLTVEGSKGGADVYVEDGGEKGGYIGFLYPLLCIAQCWDSELFLSSVFLV